MYSYVHPGSFNPAAIANKEVHIIYGNNETGSSQAAGFHKKTSRKFLTHQPVVLVKCKGQTETLTIYFERKENIFYLIQLKIFISVDSFLCISRGSPVGFAGSGIWYF